MKREQSNTGNIPCKHTRRLCGGGSYLSGSDGVLAEALTPTPQHEGTTDIRQRNRAPELADEPSPLRVLAKE